MRWLDRMVVEKVVDLVVLSIIAFLASRTHHPTWKWGRATGIAAAVAFQIIAMLVYLFRFGETAFRDYNNFLLTMCWTVMLGWLFGYLAVRRQCLHERHSI
jgi:hypothetical protein